MNEDIRETIHSVEYDEYYAKGEIEIARHILKKYI